ncbi:MAG: ribbon-helix-helix protein, CopG family [Gemmatimonadaceae bacterium]|nr:ribbon-helix-helix protein, CopG family [Gemmatimonadaceae bacterium]
MTTTFKTDRRLLNFWVEHDVAEQIEARAAREERSRSAEIRLAIREHLERSEAKGETT